MKQDTIQIERCLSSVPNFQSWKQNAIKTKADLQFAPEDFYLIDTDGNRVSYFSWGEAIRIERHILLPNGWCLPTLCEWERICGHYKSVRSLTNDLLLGFHGWFNPYNGSVSSEGIAGYYWSSKADDFHNAFSLEFRKTNMFPHIYSNSRFYKFSIRCIVDA